MHLRSRTFPSRQPQICVYVRLLPIGLARPRRLTLGHRHAAIFKYQRRPGAWICGMDEEGRV